MSIPKAAYWHALNQITKGNSWKLWRVSEQLNGPNNIFTSNINELLAHGLNQKQAEYLSTHCKTYPILNEYIKAVSDGTQILIKTDPDYPTLLNQTYDSPAILYVKGNQRLLKDNLLAIVGSRHMSTYGKEVIKSLTPPLVQSGLGVVSGLAYGVDATALEACLDQNGTTVAVIASSLVEHELSPKGNIKLAQRIIEQGCLVSETPPGCLPAKGRFPLRNRIVSGVSQGVLVIEAAMRSGSLITARLGLEQNREIFAVPGSIFASKSQGTLWLIQQGAKCVITCNDILQELNLPQTKSQSEQFKPANDLQTAIWSLISAEPTSMDQIIEQTKIPAQLVLSELTAMEMSGNLRRLANGVYDKVS